MKIPDYLLSCVVFIGMKEETGGKTEIKWRGTGFFVSQKSKNNPEIYFEYLVTAKHVIVGTGGNAFFIRVNTKEGKSAIIRVRSDTQWFYHPDEAKGSDVAVSPFGLDMDAFATLDYRTIPIDIFFNEETRKAENYGPGDEALIIGLFSQHAGNAKNLPIVRTGNIAMIPDEPVPTKAFGDLEVYLIEARSIRGISGSPVFARKQKPPGRCQITLLGLIHGHWDVLGGVDEKEINVGIAMVIPAQKILETILQPALDGARAKIEEFSQPPQ